MCSTAPNPSWLYLCGSVHMFPLLLSVGVLHSPKDSETATERGDGKSSYRGTTPSCTSQHQDKAEALQDMGRIMLSLQERSRFLQPMESNATSNAGLGTVNFQLQRALGKLSDRKTSSLQSNPHNWEFCHYPSSPLTAEHPILCLWTLKAGKTCWLIIGDVNFIFTCHGII